MPSITSLPNDADFRTDTLGVSGEDVRVDRKKRTIYGASLMQLGRINDSRPWKVDELTLEQALSLMQRGGEAGTKGRFTHPNMSNDGLGNFLGRWVNPRIDNDRLRADLVLSERAFSGPRGDMGTYLLDMAESEADMLGVSLATRMNREAMEASADADGIEPIRLTAVHAADIVDQPAATRGGFFSTGGLDELPEHATRALDHYFENATPDVIRTRATNFLDRYLSNRYGDADAMSTETKGQNKGKTDEPAGDFVTKADLEGLFESFGTKLSSTLLGQIDEKLAANPKPAADGKEDEGEQLSADQIRTAERQRVTDLMNLASSAGLKDAEKTAKEWVDKDFSVSEAKQALGELVIKQNLLSRDEGDTGADEGLEAKLRAEFRDQDSVHTGLGITEDEYVEFRKEELAKSKR